MTLTEWRDWCINQHDVECNQKYDTRLPYSMHLRYVVAQFHRFKHLLPNIWEDYILNIYEAAEMGCWGHDVIEDARTTYNDVKDKVGKAVADIIFGCTEDTGRTREERHSDIYYMRCAANRLSTFVKLCDIIANVTYSILTKSSMYKKHLAEHEKNKKWLYKEEFKPMFDHLDKLFAVCGSLEPSSQS